MLGAVVDPVDLCAAARGQHPPPRAAVRRLRQAVDVGSSRARLAERPAREDTDNQLFAALGITAPRADGRLRCWAAPAHYPRRFCAGQPLCRSQAQGWQPVHGTQVKRVRHPNFFQHECLAGFTLAVRRGGIDARLNHPF
jgi:hypothetical protein